MSPPTKRSIPADEMRRLALATNRPHARSTDIAARRSAAPSSRPAQWFAYLPTNLRASRAAALCYQHATGDRDKAIAHALSGVALVAPATGHRHLTGPLFPQA